MRALTLHPHWAFAVSHLGKRIENRSRPYPSALDGQRIAIHAGARAVTAHDWAGLQRAARRSLVEVPIASRCIVATAVLSGQCDRDQRDGDDGDSGLERPLWGDDAYNWWWHLSDVRRLVTPVPVARGQLGLWHLSEADAEAVERAEWVRA